MSRVVKLSRRHQSEYGMKKHLSRYYVHLQMKQPPNRRYYGTEGPTLAKIVYRKLQQVQLSGKQGLRNCLALERRYRGRYHTATIYQRHPGGTWQPFASFTDGGQRPQLKQLPKPAPIVRLRVVHHTAEGSVSFIPNQQAA